MSFDPERSPLPGVVDLQDQMRRGPDGRLVCERCGGRVRLGWVYHFGSIALATCGRKACAPKVPGWLIGVRFS